MQRISNNQADYFSIEKNTLLFSIFANGWANPAIFPMHEISLVRTIFRTLEDHFSEEELKRVIAIELKVGPLANVETILLQNAFDAVVEEDEVRFKDVQLRVHTVPILVQCPDCEQITEVYNYKFVCVCGKPCGNVVQGNELLIERVEMRD